MSSSLGLAPPLPIPTQPSATPPLPPITGTGPPNIPSLSSQLLPPAPPQPPPYPPQTVAIYNNSNSNGPLYGEEISTIFVVGFPDDMQEREFQNMFIFSPGFEAATLKVPSKDGEEDPNVSTVNGNPQNKKQIIGFAKFRSRGEALDAKDTISGRKVDAEKGSVLKAEMAKKNLHTKRGLSSNDPFQLNQLPAMLPPHDLLQQQQQQQQQHLHHPSVPPLPTAPYQQQDDNHTSVKRSTGPHHSSVYEAFHSVPASDPTLISDIYSDLFIPNTTTNGSNNASSTGIRSIQPATTTSATGNNPSTRLSGLFSPTHRFSSGNIFDLPQRPDIKPPPTTASLSNTEPVDLLEKADPPISSHVNPSTLADETTVSLSSSSSIPQALHQHQHQHQQQQNIYHHHHHHHHHNQQQQQHLHLHSSSPPPPPLLTNRFMDDDQQQQQHHHHHLGSAFGGLTINTNPLHSTNITNTSSTLTTAAANTTSLTSTPTTIASNGGLPSPGLLSPNGYRSFSTMMMMASTNPADQNPPCNTLYVGNLPPNTDEEELKQLFYKCVGYKRLSFRQKANGPMCFVEFDDVYCATIALQELHGNPLSNSVKGGIRLSFSKNPLGVRQNSISNSGCNATNGVFNPSVVPYYRDNLSFDPPYS